MGKRSDCFRLQFLGKENAMDLNHCQADPEKHQDLRILKTYCCLFQAFIDLLICPASGASSAVIPSSDRSSGSAGFCRIPKTWQHLKDWKPDKTLLGFAQYFSKDSKSDSSTTWSIKS